MTLLIVKAATFAKTQSRSSFQFASIASPVVPVPSFDSSVAAVTATSTASAKASVFVSLPVYTGIGSLPYCPSVMANTPNSDCNTFVCAGFVNLIKIKGMILVRNLLITLLFIFSSSSFADAILMVDGTAKYGKTGVLQNTFPGIPLFKCAQISTACTNLVNSHANVGVVFTNFQKMNKFVKSHPENIDTLQFIGVGNYPGKFKLRVWDSGVIDDNGYLVNVAFIQVILGKNRVSASSVAAAIAFELQEAYDRLNTQ